MLDSTYTQAANPNSMRDQGLCRNAVYNIEDALLSPSDGNMDSFYKGDPEFMSSSLDWRGEKERAAYFKTANGDTEVQGILEYPNHDIYSYGGRSNIH